MEVQMFVRCLDSVQLDCIHETSITLNVFIIQCHGCDFSESLSRTVMFVMDKYKIFS